MVEFPLTCHRPDLDPAQAEPCGALLELADGELRVLQGDRPQADQPAGVRTCEGGDPLVGLPDECGGHVFIRPRVVQRHGRDELDVDPGLVHRGQPALNVGQQRPEPR